MTGARLANGGRTFIVSSKMNWPPFLGKKPAMYIPLILGLCLFHNWFCRPKDLLVDKNLHSSLWRIKLSGARCERFSTITPIIFVNYWRVKILRRERSLSLKGSILWKGHIAKLPEFIELAREFNAFVILDDAHGFEFWEDRDGGFANHFNLTDEIDVICAAFQKITGWDLGRFVAASREAIEYMNSLKQTIFHALSPSSSCYCARAAPHPPGRAPTLGKAQSKLRTLSFDAPKTKVGHLGYRNSCHTHCPG